MRRSGGDCPQGVETSGATAFASLMRSSATTPTLTAGSQPSIPSTSANITLLLTRSARRSRMLVSNLQQFLVLLLPPLRAAGLNATADKSVTSSLEAMATALDPFKDLSIEQVADLLKVTQEYRHTGQIPNWVLARKPPASKARTSTPKTPKKAPKPPKMTPAEAL